MNDRPTASTITDAQLDALYDEIARLRAGEETVTDPAVEPTPAQWLWQYNRAAPEDRLRVIEALLRDSAQGRNCFFMAHEKRLQTDREAEATVARVRQVWDSWQLMTLEPGQVRRLLDEVGRALDVPGPKETAPAQVEPDPVVAQEAVRQMDADPHGLKAGMVVQPYREHGQEKWAFRCWGTDDGCEGLLSLDHFSRQGAERARDRHVAEEHAEPTPCAGFPDRCPNLRAVVPTVGSNLGGGLRCGCGDQPKEKPDA